MDFQMDIPLEPPPPYPFKSLTSFKSLLNRAKVAWIVAGVLFGMLMIASGACFVYSRTPKWQPPICANRHIVPKPEPIFIGGTRYVYDVTAVDLNGHRVNTKFMTSEADPEKVQEQVEQTKKMLEDDLKLEAEAEKHKQVMAERVRQIQEEEEKLKMALNLIPFKEDWIDDHDIIPTKDWIDDHEIIPEKDEEPEDSESSEDEPERVKFQDVLGAKIEESEEMQ